MKSRTIRLMCALVLATTGAVAAQQQADQPKPGTTTALADSSTQTSAAGTVVSSTSTELVIDTDAGGRMTFALDPATAPATTFTPGERVSVQYHTASGGTVHQAASIAVEPKAKVASPETEPPTADSPRLPETASNLALIGLLGLLVAGSAVAVRVARS